MSRCLSSSGSETNSLLTSGKSLNIPLIIFSFEDEELDIFGIAYMLREGCYSSSIHPYIRSTKLIMTQFVHSHIQIQSKPFFLKSADFNIITNIVKLLFNTNCFWNEWSSSLLFFYCSIILACIFLYKEFCMKLEEGSILLQFLTVCLAWLPFP